VGPPGSGQKRHWLVSRFPVRDHAGAIIGVTSMRTDVTALKLAEARLAELLASEQSARAQVEQARHLLDEHNRQLAEQVRRDALTGLASRSAFLEHLTLALSRASRQAQAAAVLYLDLDSFKQVNDAHGHAAGDRLLQIIAERLRAVARKTDLVARHGGDEFLLLLADLDREQAPEIAAEIAGRIHQAIAQPVTLDGISARVSTSIGIALYPDDATDVDALIAAADAEMYRSKQAGPARTALAGERKRIRPARGPGRLRPAG
jgi:diguanylate cyclase (GGDEF)-like protein